MDPTRWHIHSSSRLYLPTAVQGKTVRLESSRIPASIRFRDMQDKSMINTYINEVANSRGHQDGSKLGIFSSKLTAPMPQA